MRLSTTFADRLWRLGRRGCIIEGFLFDLGNVLVHFSNDRMCRQMGDLVGWSAQRVADVLMETRLHQQLERGAIDDAQFHAEFERLAGRTVPRQALFDAASNIFEVNRPMVDIVAQLKRQGKRLVLLSNTCRPHIDWIRSRFNVLEHFDGLVLSYEAKAAKPESRAFELALEMLALPPDRCLYTDDIAEFVQAGIAHGLRGHVFTSVADWLATAKSLGVATPVD